MERILGENDVDQEQPQAKPGIWTKKTATHDVVTAHNRNDNFPKHFQIAGCVKMFLC